MPRAHKPKSTIPVTITWPPETGIEGHIDPAIDEITIDNYPFEGHHQAMVAAQVHIDIAQHAASRTDQPESDNDARIAFENAVIAKQCIHYAYLDAGHNYPEPTDNAATLIATADQLLVNNQRAPTPTKHRHEELLDQDLEIALAEARAHSAALETIVQLVEQLPHDNLLAAEVNSQHRPEDPEPPTPEEERNTGLIRMASYLGDPPKGRNPRIRELPAYQAVIRPLVQNANQVIFAHELNIKQVMGDHAIRHEADAWGMTDELYGTEGIEIDTHTCDERCHVSQATRHSDGHNIFMAYMHNGIRYIQAATEPFPHGFPRPRALQITERIRTFLEKTYENDLFDDDLEDDRPYWRILHDLHGAVAVGVHDIDPLSIEMTHTPIIGGQPTEEGLMQHILHAIALDNLHAARFLAGATIPTRHLVPDERQVKAIIHAAQHAGMDAHQVAYLAEALYQDPLTAGVIHPKTDEIITKRVQQDHMDLPKANNRHLALRLRQP